MNPNEIATVAPESHGVFASLWPFVLVVALIGLAIWGFRFIPKTRLLRKTINYTIFTAAGVCLAVVLGALIVILGYLLWKGAHSLNWDFFTKIPVPPGMKGGGVANALVGSGELLLMATALGVPLGFLGAIYLAEYGGKTFPFLVRYATDLLNGVPSIVVGIFAYTVVVVPMKHFSALAGGVALGIMMIPIALRTTEEFLRSVPNSLREASLALGASKWRTIITVVVPAAIHGIVGGIMLDLARVAGETAPLLFTTFGNEFWSHSITRPTAAVPLVIFEYATGPYTDWHKQAWAAGFVLLISILIVNIIARSIMHMRYRPA
ncbi:MAG: phosphate ABC transporter permease PstA [Phycisphaerae bacterium]